MAVLNSHGKDDGDDERRCLQERDEDVSSTPNPVSPEITGSEGLFATKTEESFEQRSALFEHRATTLRAPAPLDSLSSPIPWGTPSGSVGRCDEELRDPLLNPKPVGLDYAGPAQTGLSCSLVEWHCDKALGFSLEESQGKESDGCDDRATTPGTPAALDSLSSTIPSRLDHVGPLHENPSGNSSRDLVDATCSSCATTSSPPALDSIKIIPGFVPQKYLETSVDWPWAHAYRVWEQNCSLWYDHCTRAENFICPKFKIFSQRYVEKHFLRFTEWPAPNQQPSPHVRIPGDFRSLGYIGGAGPPEIQEPSQDAEDTNPNENTESIDSSEDSEGTPTEDVEGTDPIKDGAPSEGASSTGSKSQGNIRFDNTEKQ